MILAFLFWMFIILYALQLIGVYVNLISYVYNTKKEFLLNLIPFYAFFHGIIENYKELYDEKDS